LASVLACFLVTSKHSYATIAVHFWVALPFSLAILISEFYLRNIRSSPLFSVPAIVVCCLLAMFNYLDLLFLVLHPEADESQHVVMQFWFTPVLHLLAIPIFGIAGFIAKRLLNSSLKNNTGS